MSERNNITYQNKDITSKYLGENLKDKSFAVYGLDVPKIIRVLPTNLPAIEANELRLDNLFLLEDGSMALVDYESIYADEDKIKYLNYIVRTLKRNMGEKSGFCKIRMIVIYTADIEPEQTTPMVDVGCLQFRLEEAFLSGLDSETVEKEIHSKIEKGEKLTDEELMKFIILPLTYKGREEKQKCIKRCFEMAKGIGDDKEQVFVLSGMLVFADKIINREDSIRIQEWIRMTKVGQLFEEEKIEYGKKQEQKAAREKEEELARKLLISGDSVEKIANIMTILTRDEIVELKNKER